MIELIADESVTIVVAAFTTFATLAVTHFFNCKYHIFQLNYDYRHEQRKLLKQLLGKNRTFLLNSAEDMNYRLWNFKKNISKKWHCQSQQNWKKDSKYYIQSFVFCFLILFYYTRKIERETFFIDSTVTSTDDYTFLKYIKVLQLLFCESALLNVPDKQYDDSHAKNHFFKYDFNDIPNYVASNDGTLSFADFKHKINENPDPVEDIRRYIASAGSDDNLNYYVMQLFHLILIAFLNRYGHDYQYTEASKVKALIHDYHDNPLFQNFSDFLKRNKLDRENELKSILRQLNF